MTAIKTNEVRPGETPGVRAKLSFVWVSAFKVRQVLDLIRGKGVEEAASILRRCERGPAEAVGKVLKSAVANAETNSGMDPEELYVSACYADEGMTFKRFRPRARGRAGRIRKRTSHVTIVVNRLPEDRLSRLRAKQAADLASRRRRVAGSRRRRGAEAEGDATAVAAAEAVERAQSPAPDAEVTDAPTAEVTETAAPETETTESVEAPAADAAAADETQAETSAPEGDEPVADADEEKK